MFFRFPPDARWNPDCSAVEFGVGIGEYEGIVRVPRRVFQSLLEQTPIPERCLEAYHLPDATRIGRGAEGAPSPTDRRWQCRDHRAVICVSESTECLPVRAISGGLLDERDSTSCSPN